MPPKKKKQNKKESQLPKSEVKVDEQIIKCPIKHIDQELKVPPMEAFGCPMGVTSKSSNAKVIRPKRGIEPVYYHKYLQLDQILSAQKPLSLEIGKSLAHDEMLFIVTHQTYELWFKQILHELDSCLDIFSVSPLPEKSLSIIVHRLQRVTKIQQVLVDQLAVLETMTPMSFLDFREYLFPASGFQSVQFRLVENKLGLNREQRINYSGKPYTEALQDAHKPLLEESEKKPSLFERVEKWLERTPFLKQYSFDFWTEYQECVKKMFEEDIKEINQDVTLTAEMREERLKDINHTQDVYDEFFDEKKYEEMVHTGKRRLSYKATQAAIMINLYREEPILQLPFQLLTLLLDIDKLLTSWRTHHALMVHRMLGMKMGTGGSSGYNYLKATVTYHKIFADFANLSMFFVPHAAIPKLPSLILKDLRFRSDSVDED